MVPVQRLLIHAEAARPQENLSFKIHTVVVIVVVVVVVVIVALCPLGNDCHRRNWNSSTNEPELFFQYLS